MRARHTFKALVTGPCATGTAALLQSVSQVPVVATELGGFEGTGQGTMGVGLCDLHTADVGDVRLVLLGVRASASPLLEVVLHEVDVVCLVVDAAAPHTHAVAGRLLQSCTDGPGAPVVVAVHGTDDLSAARRLVRSLGVVPSGRVIACRLEERRSARDVVVFALESLLDVLGTSRSDQEVA